MEEILYQYIMSSRAYRRKMIAVRATITAIVAGGLFGILAISVALGIILPVVMGFLGAIWIIAGLQREENYTVLNTRFIIKNKEKNISVPLENIAAVKYHRAFYEKDIATGTVIITAKSESGKLKKYKFRHVFDGNDGVKFLKEQAEKNGATNEGN